MTVDQKINIAPNPNIPNNTSKEKLKRKAAYLMLSGITLGFIGDMYSLFRQKDQIIFNLADTSCLMNAIHADNYLERGNNGEAISIGWPAFATAYLKSKNINPGFFTTICENSQIPRSFKRSELGTKGGVEIIQLPEINPDSKHLRIPLEIQLSDNQGMAMKIPESYKFIGDEVLEPGENWPFSKIYKYSDSQTDYYLFPGFNTNSGKQLLRDLGLGRLPRRPDGVLIEGSPGFFVKKIVDQKVGRFFIQRPDIVEVNDPKNFVVISGHMDIYNSQNKIDESAKFFDTVGEKFREGDIGDLSVYIVQNSQGEIDILNGSEIRNMPDRTSLDSALHLTWPVISNEEVINVEGFPSVHTLHFNIDGDIMGITSFVDVVNAAIVSGNISAQGVFKSSQGIFLFSIPPGILTDNSMFNSYLHILESSYGKITEMALGDLDFGSYLGYSDKDNSNTFPQLVVDSQIFSIGSQD